MDEEENPQVFGTINCNLRQSFFFNENNSQFTERAVIINDAEQDTFVDGGPHQIYIKLKWNKNKKNLKIGWECKCQTNGRPLRPPCDQCEVKLN